MGSRCFSQSNIPCANSSPPPSAGAPEKALQQCNNIRQDVVEIRAAACSSCPRTWNRTGGGHRQFGEEDESSADDELVLCEHRWWIMQVRLLGMFGVRGGRLDCWTPEQCSKHSYTAPRSPSDTVESPFYFIEVDA